MIKVDKLHHILVFGYIFVSFRPTMSLFKLITPSVTCYPDAYHIIYNHMSGWWWRSPFWILYYIIKWPTTLWKFDSYDTFQTYIKQSKQIKSNGHLFMKLRKSSACIIYQSIFLLFRIRNKVSSELLVRRDYYSQWQIDSDMISS